MNLLKNISKSSHKVLQHNQGDVPELVPLECNVRTALDETASNIIVVPQIRVDVFLIFIRIFMTCSNNGTRLRFVVSGYSNAAHEFVYDRLLPNLKT